jgi:anti-anti-sigma regulatory factor
MVMRITQTDDLARTFTTLRVEGTLRSEDAFELEEIAIQVGPRLGHTVVIDLTALQVLDEASAAVLRRLKHPPGVSLIGCQLFIKQRIEATVDA